MFSVVWQQVLVLQVLVVRRKRERLDGFAQHAKSLRHSPVGDGISVAWAIDVKPKTANEAMLKNVRILSDYPRCK
jgi:ribosomal protein S12